MINSITQEQYTSFLHILSQINDIARSRILKLHNIIIKQDLFNIIYSKYQMYPHKDIVLTSILGNWDSYPSSAVSKIKKSPNTYKSFIRVIGFKEDLVSVEIYDPEFYDQYLIEIPASYIYMQDKYFKKLLVNIEKQVKHNLQIYREKISEIEAKFRDLAQKQRYDRYLELKQEFEPEQTTSK